MDTSEQVLQQLVDVFIAQPTQHNRELLELYINHFYVMRTPDELEGLCDLF